MKQKPEPNVNRNKGSVIFSRLDDICSLEPRRSHGGGLENRSDALRLQIDFARAVRFGRYKPKRRPFQSPFCLIVVVVVAVIIRMIGFMIVGSIWMRLLGRPPIFRIRPDRLGVVVLRRVVKVDMDGRRTGHPTMRWLGSVDPCSPVTIDVLVSRIVVVNFVPWIIEVIILNNRRARSARTVAAAFRSGSVTTGE